MFGVNGWVLAGMFGWGVGIGLAIAFWLGRRITATRQGDALWWEPLWRGVAAVLGVVVIPPLMGIVAVVATFAAHGAEWALPARRLAATGLVFLLIPAAGILWVVYRPRPS